jgi:hypothetical protein
MVLRNDFFLGSSTDVFVESARHLISESYCKIHQRIDIRWVFHAYEADEDGLWD